jgi:hypothetical protein
MTSKEGSLEAELRLFLHLSPERSTLYICILYIVHWHRQWMEAARGLILIKL